MILKTYQAISNNNLSTKNIRNVIIIGISRNQELNIYEFGIPLRK